MGAYLPDNQPGPLLELVGVVGSGIAGLITAHILLQDGFKVVEVLTRDRSVGGIWSEEPPSGEDVRQYMEDFAKQFNLNIRREDHDRGWNVLVHNNSTGTEKGCSKPHYPEPLTPAAAKLAQFPGPVLHSMHFRSRIDDLLSCTPPVDPRAVPVAPIVGIGGGKSAQEFLSIMSPHKELRTRLGRSLHAYNSSRCSYSVLFLASSGKFFGEDLPPSPGVSEKFMILSQFYALGISRDSPLLAKFGDDGHSVVLEDGRVLPAAAVILATGYKSTWRSIFDNESMDSEQLGLGRHRPGSGMSHHWDYVSLANLPVVPLAGETPLVASIYRGLVPAKNILNRDFAVNGGMFSAHHAYVRETSAHWISAYFRRDALRLPQSVDEAHEATEHDAAWVRPRCPYFLNWMDEGNTRAVAFWT
ncbi:hypothetical protein BJV78DRAFT_1157962 [Lactifluus subvellereus]|nr:hypothetical protein BJV78DRAFT_1157962 [Lactifluus subvellereus]